jgi:hypothetical protein
MDLNRHFPYVVACYLIAVGFFFILSDILDTAYLSAEPPGKYYLHGFSVVFIIAGACAIYLKHQGKLKKSGKTIKEVRLEAIENLTDATLLANIALKQEDEEIQSAAQERLKDLSD